MLLKDKIIDISVLVNDKLPLWPGSPELKLCRDLDIDRGDKVTDTSFGGSLHVGTHIDVASHYYAGAKSVEDYTLDAFCGRVQVLDFQGISMITKSDLESRDIIDGIEKILLKTDNSKLWSFKDHAFKEDYVSISEEAASWLIDNNISLVGIDYLSIEKYGGTGDVHKILLKNDVVILETLDLSSVDEGVYDLFCLPIRIDGVEASPVRAILYNRS